MKYIALLLFLILCSGIVFFYFGFTGVYVFILSLLLILTPIINFKLLREVNKKLSGIKTLPNDK